MRVSDIIQMGKSYLMLGLLVVAAAAILYCIGYFLIYRKVMKGNKRPSKVRLVLGGIFICYLVVVVGATMLARTGGYEGRVQGLFASYLNAWYSFDLMDWRNLILNICMFVPFGFLLPFAFEKLRSFWKTYLAGFIVTIIIEGLQFLLHIGVFEADDILNNLIGTMIGYGLACLVFRVFGLKQRKKIFLLTVQFPLILTVVFLGAVFLLYDHKEYGNMISEYNMHIKNIDVSGSMEFSEEKETVNVYHVKEYGQEETKALADSIFEKFGTSVDESRNDAYQNSVIYYSLDGNYSIWVYYRGLTYDYTDFSQFEDGSEPKLGCSREEIEAALDRFGITVPASAVFQERENGYYEFTVEDDLQGDKMIDGNLSCRYMENGRIDAVNNNIKTYDKYGACDLISEKDAFEKLQAGEFYSFYDLTGSEIEITGVELEYMLDSKGFYRPVYCFSAKSAEEIGYLMIPAIE